MLHKEKESTLNHLIWEEFACHAPYGMIAVTIGLVILSLSSALLTTKLVEVIAFKKITKVLFHTFHFMHIVFAISGTILTYSRFSKNFIRTIIVGVFSPSIFCLLSDVILPYIGAHILGISAKMHICFIEEPLRLLPFLCIGLLNGIIMAYYGDRKKWLHTIGSHATHVFISVLASIFYLLSQGFAQSNIQIGNVFLLLIAIVIIPCALSDIVIPMLIAKGGAHHHEEH